MSVVDAQPGRRALRALIAGNPNSGKTSLFNAMTGSYQRVGNYPGVTVERKEGQARVNGTDLVIVDLPGTYSLTAHSADELVARKAMLEHKPDVVIAVVDAANLERNLYLVVQIMEMELPLVIALNMADVAERRGLRIDMEKMSQLLGVPVARTVGRSGTGVSGLLAACRDVALNGTARSVRGVTYGHEVDDRVDALASVIASDAGIGEGIATRWAAVKLIEQDPEVAASVQHHAEDAAAIERAAGDAARLIEEHFGESAESIIVEARYAFVAGVLRECVQEEAHSRRSQTDLIDDVVCHRISGPLVLAGVVFCLFVVVFKIADEWAWVFGRSPTEWMEWAFAKLAGGVSGLASSSPMLHSLLADGVIGGVGGVMSFVPLLFIMFAFIAILEDTGYMARAAFVLDRAMKVFGLQGKSVLPMILSGGLGGGGCAVPGVMATRVLREKNDRLVTMLVAPLMNCGAKLPVYMLLIAAFFPSHQAKVMFVLWLLSWVFALCAAWLIRRFVVSGEQTPFVMELPVYHVPTVRGVLRHTWQRTWLFVKKAGTLILATSIILWALMYFPRADAGTDVAAQLRHSVAGRLGATLEPVSRWAGFDWRDNIALVGGIAAKEVVVGTLGVAYAMGDEGSDDAASLSERLRTAPGWSPLRAFAMMVFVMLYAPCVMVQIVTWRESGSWRWPLFSLAYTTTFAFTLAVGIYQIGAAFGLGT